MSLLQDPFYVVKEEVQQSVSGVTTLYDRWQELLKATNTAQNDEFKWTTTQIKNGIKSIEWDLQDLEETIGIVEGNRQRFKLDASEVESRKGFITETKATIKKMKDDLNNAATKGKMENDARSTLMNTTRKSPSDNGKFDGLHKAIIEDNDQYINNSRQQIQQTMDAQDEDLEAISRATGNLKEIGITINDELKLQGHMLEEMDTEVDKTNSRLNNTLKRLNKLIDSTSDRVQWCMVIVLTLILIGLIVIVFYV
jgi:chromosome segregation ATPase